MSLFLVVFQVVASLVILVVAGLLLRSLGEVDSFDPDLRPTTVALVTSDG